jgi:sterol desaturase/sphingolipid hydroxylase (fatty acid hydroxylase superfamily)
MTWPYPSLDLGFFVFPLLVFLPLERLFAAHPSHPILRRGWLMDLAYVFLNRPIIHFGLAAVIVVVGFSCQQLVPAAIHRAIRSQPVWLQVVQVVVLADLGFYVAHRAFHTVPALWRFHAIHHSIEHLDWLAAARVHPVDQILTKGVSILIPFTLGYSEHAIAIFGVLYFWHSVLLHANLRLGFGALNAVVASPRFHHWHHANERSARDKNFAGQLSLFDRLFGTFHLPDTAPTRYGVDDPVPGTYVRNLLYPLMWRPRAPLAAREAIPGSG